MKQHSIHSALENKTANQWLSWLRAYDACPKPRPLTKEENLALRDAIINPKKGYERVAQEFFYVTIKPMMCGFAYQIHKTYHTDVNTLDLSTTIYREIWDGGKFTRLTGYKGDCSLFGWIAKGAAQVIYEDLENQGIIKKSSSKSTSNTSLRLKSFNDNEELSAVLSLVTQPLWHYILTELYVNRATEEEMMKKIGLDEFSMKRTLKVAEAALKDQLIATEVLLWHRPGKKTGEKGTTINLVSKALGDVSGCLHATSSDSTFATSAATDDNGIYDEIRDVLRLDYSGMASEAMWDTFVKDQAIACGMTENQLKVWTARYVHHEDPVSVAARLDIRRANVDNLFSRANSVLVRHLRRWWRMSS